MGSDVLTRCRQVEQEERWVSVTGCEKKKATGSSWQRCIKRGIQNRDLGWWVGSSYLQSLSVKGKRRCVLVIRDVSIKKSSVVFLSESEQVWRWKGASLWTGKTEDVRLIVELDT